MSNSNNLGILFVWALLPIFCFMCVMPMAKWFADENNVKTTNNYDAIAWGKIIASSPDIRFQNVDSINYYGKNKKESLKKDNIVAADITHLFPDFEVKKLTILDNGQANPVFEVWNHNGTVYTGWIERQSHGYFALVGNERSEGKTVPIGRFIGKMNYIQDSSIYLPATTMNVSVFMAFALCLIGFGLAMTSTVNPPHMSWLVIVSYVAMSLTGVYVIFWFTGWGQFYGSMYNYPEWITIAWLISEVGLLSGVLYKLSAVNKRTDNDTNEAGQQQKMLNLQK